MCKNACWRSAAVFFGLFALAQSPASAVEYTTATPLSEVVKTPAKACGTFPQLPVPVIAWGAEEATIVANGSVVTPSGAGVSSVTQPGSLFAKEGLLVRLYREDSVARQLEDFLSCKTPFLRMTAGMLAQSTDVLARAPAVAVYKHSFSVGGDVLVVRDHIKDLKDIKTVALQAYGPHADYMATLWRSAGLDLTQVQIKWVKDITEGDASSQYPAKALREDPTVDAVFVISPDATELTSGKGESAVKGAHVLFSTKMCDTCIADLYIARQDWADANPQTVQKFVHALMLSNEATQKLFAEKDARKDEFGRLMTASAKMLLDDASKVADAEGMWGDLRMDGFRGNVKFFTDDNWPRNFTHVTQEASEAMVALRLVAKTATFTHLPLDYAALAVGLTDTTGVDMSHWNKAAVAAVMRKRQQDGTEAVGQKFRLDVPFKRESAVIDIDLYQQDFDKIIDLAQTYGGLLFTVTGHVDPQEYLKAKYVKGGTPEQLSQIRQHAVNISGERALAFRNSLIRYAASKHITLDPNQFEIIAAGFMKPSKPDCTIENGDITLLCAASSKAEMLAERRAVLRAIAVTAEMEEFEALNPAAK